MSIAFESSHVTGDFSSGRLTVGIWIADDRSGVSTWDEIEFEVPPDFHAHNDAVAAALMTLVGQRYPEVTFNFPVSTACADLLGRYYTRVTVRPVDPKLKPRRPGKRLGLNFSGGLDSTTAWVILNEALDGDFAVITSEYGGTFTREAQNFGRYQRDVSCVTNLRMKGYSGRGRFNFCVPLLFADYLDLRGIATGHANPHRPADLAIRQQGRPEFLHDDLVVNAGRLEEVHLLRGLQTHGVLTILVALAPERVEPALVASYPLGTAKHYTRARILRDIFLDHGLPLPAYLDPLPPIPADVSEFGIDASLDIRTLYFVKRQGIEPVRGAWPWVAQLDLSILDELAFTFPMRYNTTVVDQIPKPLRSRFVQVFRRCGIEPYDQRDWQDIDRLREFLRLNGARYLQNVE